MTEKAPRGPWPPLSTEQYRIEAVAVLGEELVSALSHIKLMVFDCDGVLTSGNLIYGPGGEALKEFHSHDGLGLVMTRMVGIKRAVLTGRNSPIVARRCTELRFDSIKMGRFDKVLALSEILAETGCLAEETLYMGDDLIDLPAMYEVKIAIGVPAAPVDVKNYCKYITKASGGQGAVREVTDLVLKSAGLYTDAMVRLGDKVWHPTKQELSSDSDEELTQ